MSQVLKWPKIMQFQHIPKKLQFMGLDINQPIRFNAKVKLHGTNAGVRITPEGSVIAQSRKNDLVNGQDNAGFAEWVKQHHEYFSTIANPEVTKVIFGEWCGQNIQKGVAISQIGMKIFAVFSVRYYIDGRCVKEIFNPEDILEECLPIGLQLNHPYLDMPERMFILPYHHVGLEVNFSDMISKAAAAEVMHEMTMAVEAEDPWVKSMFDISGIGEGLVWYPASDQNIGVHEDRDVNLMFKTKGEKHSATKVKKLTVQFTVDQVKQIEQFVESFVTEARCEQGLKEACDGVADMTTIGKFIGWMSTDIKSESTQEVEASEFTWKQLNKAVVNAVKKWYTEKCSQV